MPYTTVVMIVCCAVLYYRIGEFEYGRGALLALVSIVLWLLGSYLFRFGALGNLLVQAGLYLALTVWNMQRAQRQ